MRYAIFGHTKIRAQRCSSKGVCSPNHIWQEGTNFRYCQHLTQYLPKKKQRPPQKPQVAYSGRLRTPRAPVLTTAPSLWTYDSRSRRPGKRRCPPPDGDGPSSGASAGTLIQGVASPGRENLTSNPKLPKPPQTPNPPNSQIPQKSPNSKTLKPQTSQNANHPKTPTIPKCQPNPTNPRNPQVPKPQNPFLSRGLLQCSAQERRLL